MTLKHLYTLITSIVIIVCTVFAASAQRPSGPPSGYKSGSTPKVGYGKLGGIVTDENDEPVPYATVRVLNDKDDKLIDGTIAEEDGKWVIRNVPEGDFKIIISFMGYESINKGPYKVTGKGESYDLGRTVLASSVTELDQVVVEGQRELIEDKVDRIVYNASQDNTTAGGDASDVLRRVPLLSVDLDGNVSLRGSSNLTVLIDGKPSTITAGNLADALRQIPADEIESVEVITSPSARYDAEGTGGIINIITKKNNLKGGTLSVRTGVGYRGSNLGLNAGYRTGKLGLTLGGNGFAGYNILGSTENEQIVTDEFGNELSRTNQFAETVSSRISGRYNFGWDYTFNKYNFIGGGVNYRIFDSRNDQNDRLTEFTNAMGSTSFVQDVFTLTNSNSVDVNFNYIRSFEKKGKEISLISLYSQDSRNNDFTIENISGTNPFDTRNENVSNNKEFTIQLDYVEPIGDKARFETGVKNISRTVTSDFQLLQRQDNDPYTEVQGPSVSNFFSYNQNVSAGFVSGLVELPSNFTIQAGGRYEYTTITANFSEGTDLDIGDYGTFVPSINMSKKLKNNLTMKFGYSRRIARPSLQFLNPNINAANPLDISQGNPDLLPEFTDQVEFSISRFKRTTSLNLSAFVRSTNGSIQSVTETIGQDTVYTTFQNIGEADAYGINAFGSVRKEKFTLNGGIDAFYTVLTNNIDNPLFNAENDGFVFNARLFGSYKLTDMWVIQMFGFYRSSRVQLQGFSNPFYIYSLSINRNFKNNKGSIGIGANNFATPRSFLDSETTTPLLVQRSTRELQLLNFRINFSYRIGKLTQRASKKVKKVSNDDLKDGGSTDDDQNQ
ncbi:TonB-dependent receptor domain-containing protein [Ekhidna sp. To15]|uniref:TonB-dependent receptor domain-containing protein n=1 Tax=Ekhidna sp. To15 TaxID=3395267 RepID=UPI003F52741F